MHCIEYRIYTAVMASETGICICIYVSTVANHFRHQCPSVRIYLIGCCNIDEDRPSGRGGPICAAAARAGPSSNQTFPSLLFSPAAAAAAACECDLLT